MEAVIPTTVRGASDLSSVDALWTLIMQQGKGTRRALTERMLTADVETAEQILLKSSIHRGWQQVKAMEKNDQTKGTLQDLIDSLR